MARPKKFTSEKIIKSIMDTGGIKSEICKRANITLPTLNSYIADYPEIKAAYDEELEKVLDMAEGALFSLIQNGEANAIFYYLNNKGKNRGYGSKANLTYMNDTSETQQRVVGVLVTPGILTDNEWEKAANPQNKDNQIDG